MKSKGFILAILVIIISMLSYNYMYQEHRNVLEEKSAFNISSVALYEVFNNSPLEANKKFINKIISFEGILINRDKELIVIKPSIVCKLDSNFSSIDLKLGDTLHLKGRCIGFDDLFMEVKMDNVSFKKINLCWVWRSVCFKLNILQNLIWRGEFHKLWTLFEAFLFCK